ncbi:hypothetical protein HPB47_001086 [Ixodes persulcatus]|uniref:Uncharacterized protein n=1 Tax=Ixodes persulcatus TaxID=34615 RepID=A0AC60PQB7_IXOPE|nr:hypothetical protein HPB47_001086 [Ixodes persulcatus]
MTGSDYGRSRRIKVRHASIERFRSRATRAPTGVAETSTEPRKCSVELPCLDHVLNGLPPADIKSAPESATNVVTQDVLLAPSYVTILAAGATSPDTRRPPTPGKLEMKIGQKRRELFWCDAWAAGPAVTNDVHRSGSTPSKESENPDSSIPAPRAGFEEESEDATGKGSQNWRTAICYPGDGCTSRLRFS